MDSLDQASRVRQFFDNDSSRYIQTRYEHHCANSEEYSYIKRKQMVLDLIGNGQGRLLEVGCGPGVYTPDVLDRGFEIWGFDISPKMIHLAQEKVAGHPLSKKVHFFVGDLLNLNFERDFFDMVLCIGVLSYVTDIRKAIRKIERVLKPEGVAILQASNPFSPFEMVEVSMAQPLYGLIRDVLMREHEGCRDFNMRPYSPFRLKRICREVGLEIVSLHYYDFRIPIIHKFCPKAALIISKKLEIFEKSILFGSLGGCYLLKVQKL